MATVFKDLVGQEPVIEILQGAVAAYHIGEESQAMTHAWLFTGPPGSGCSSVAVAFAQALICSNKGCDTCKECNSIKTHGHPDVDIIRTEGLSIKVEEVRELLTRVALAPSMGGLRIVVMEDANRLTEPAANALLKVIEEPGTRTVWLLCAPSLHDVLPTIRSRCRHVQLRTPSILDVTNFLRTRDNIEPETADFAARVSQGHLGRARTLATSESARNIRKAIMNLPLQLGSPADAFHAAQTFVNLVTREANELSDARDENEIAKLQEGYGKGATGHGMSFGGVKAVKELEKEQKSRSTRLVRDSIDLALLEIATFYRDVMRVQSGYTHSIINSDMRHEIEICASNSTSQSTIYKLNAIMEARANLERSSVPLITCESLTCKLAKE